jgi:ATP-dependent 26S proteasome regulatory subunit
MLLVLLYALLVFSLFVLRRTQRLTKEMPEFLIETIEKANPVCMARMLQFHAHHYSTLDVLLILSKSPEALRHSVWPLRTDFSTLQYIAWMCPEDTSTVVHRLPTLSEKAVETLETAEAAEAVEEAVEGLEAIVDSVVEAVVEVVEAPETLPTLPESPPRKKQKKTKRAKEDLQV